MTAPVPFSVMRARLDEVAREALARAGQSGLYDADAAAASIAGPCMWPYQARVVCPNAADYEDPAGYCRDHAEIDGCGR